MNPYVNIIHLEIDGAAKMLSRLSLAMRDAKTPEEEVLIYEDFATLVNQLNLLKMQIFTHLRIHRKNANVDD